MIVWRDTQFLTCYPKINLCSQTQLNIVVTYLIVGSGAAGFSLAFKMAEVCNVWSEQQ